MNTTPARLVAIAGSAGGPGALCAILRRLPSDFPACLAIVQHLPLGFVDPFASYLRSSTRLTVRVISETVRTQPGTVVLSAEDTHLLAVAPGQLGISKEAAVRGHRPSADVLFRSLATHYGSAAVGVVLSGIGSDGSVGLKLMREQGALTVAQNEKSSAVYGMPRSARDSGAASLSLDPEEISQLLLRACGVDGKPKGTDRGR